MLQPRRHGRFRPSRPNHFRHPKSYKVLCSGCGKEVIVPVAPHGASEVDRVGT